jgi:rod shape-determining protein MreD
VVTYLRSEASISVYIVAIIALILQVVLSSAISVGYAVPNFALAFAIALAISRADKTYVVLPFVVGLVFDILGASTIGAMALVCVLSAYLLARLAISVSSLTFPMICIFCFAGAFLGEVLYGILLIIGGADMSFLQALIYRALPCALYDGVIAILFSVILRRLANGAAAKDEMNIIS